MFFLCQWTTFTAVFRIRSFTADACGGKTNGKGGGRLPSSSSTFPLLLLLLRLRNNNPANTFRSEWSSPPPPPSGFDNNGTEWGLKRTSTSVSRIKKEKKKREEKMEGSTSRGRASANTQPDTSQCPQFRPESSSELMSPFQLFKTRLGRFSMATAPITSP